MHLRFAFIDALRGIAAMYVAIYHFPRITLPELIITPAWLAPLVDNGGSGVTLFFILSAFTLCLSQESRKLEATPLTNYYVRRLCRIAPLFYCWIGLFLLRNKGFWDTQGLSVLFKNIAFLFNLSFNYQTMQGIVWSSWTIGVEMLFYVIFPLIFSKANRLAKVIFWSCLSLIGVYIWHQMIDLIQPDVNAARQIQAMSFIHAFPVFLIGMAVYHWYRKLLKNQSVKDIGYLLLGVYFLCQFGGCYISSQSYPAFGAYYVIGLQYACLILGLACLPLKILVNRITCFLGEISYSIYLSHTTVMNVLTTKTTLFQTVYRWPILNTFKFLICFSAVMIVTIGVSYLTYALIEKPGIKLGKKLINDGFRFQVLPAAN